MMRPNSVTSIPRTLLYCSGFQQNQSINPIIHPRTFKLTSVPSIMTRSEEAIQQDLETASSEGQLNRIQTLLAEWKMLKNPSNGPPLQKMLDNATLNVHPEVVSYVVNAGAVITTDTIYAAATADDPVAYQALIDSGFDISQSIGHAGDALLLSVTKLPMLKWLLDHGADPNANRTATRSALEVAVMHSTTEATGLLLQHGAQLKNTSALKLAAYHGRQDMISHLLEHGVDVNEIADNEAMMPAEREIGLGTALHEAARNGQKEAIELLLKKGADASLKDSNGKTALERAKAEGHGEVVELLSKV